MVGDIRRMGLAQAGEPEVYFWFDQVPRELMNVLVRSAAPPDAMLAAMRAAIWSIRPDLPVRRSVTMADFLAQSIVAPRFYTMLLGGFAGVALMLAFVGMYSTLTYTISLREHEIGVRMALGAHAYTVRWMVLRRGMGLVVGGVLIGIGLARVLGRTLEAFIFGVTPTDSVTMSLGVATMLLAALAASLVPARRAARLDPAPVLRND